MKGKTVLIVFISIVVVFYGAGYLLHLDYMKFWPRISLGIGGLFFMLIMHIYSVRKRKRDFFLFKIFNYKLATYLNIHIILATIGVSLIIVHAIGSYDSIIAWVSFFSMAMVWQSGFVGRYIFVKIPKDNTGLIVEKSDIIDKLDDLNIQFIRTMKENNEDKNFQNFLMDYLTGYSKSLHLLHKRNEFTLARFYSNFMQMTKAWGIYRHDLSVIRKKSHEWIKKTDVAKHEILELHLKSYEEKMRDILQLQFQIEFIDILKALFKNWHDIHVPLTYLLYTTAALHVIVIVLFSSYAH